MLLAMSSFRVRRALLTVVAVTLAFSSTPRAGAQTAAPIPAATAPAQAAPAQAAPAQAAAPAAPTPAPTGPVPSGPPPAGPVPAAPQTIAPEPGAELPSLAPSPLLEPRPSATPSETDPRALSDFRPQLDPYGYWVQHPSYGLVWVPKREIVGEGFAPYVSSGHWALDETGDWVWVSDYPFGSVVFHYGRWAYVSDSGWVWVPGYRYAPAWVMWRVPTGSYAYVGWAPMPPDYGWFGGVSVSVWYGYPTPWVFCPSAYAFHHHVGYYVVRDRVLVSRIAAHSTRYIPAEPRRRAAPSTRSGPPPDAARIPAGALPRERLRVARPSQYEARPLAPSPSIRQPSRPDFRSPHPDVAPRPQQVRPQRFERRERETRRSDAYQGRPPERSDSYKGRTERRSLDPERVRRHLDADRARAPRPMPTPIRPNNAPRVRRPK